LPVAHFRGLVASLGGTPEPGILPISVAGEDLLVANHDGFALFMDPDQRDRMERMLAAKPETPSHLTAWRQWIGSNNVSVIAMPGGVRSILQWVMPENEEVNDRLFEPPDANGNPPRRRAGEDAGDVISRLRGSLRTLLQTSPRLIPMANELDAIGCGFQLGGEGTAHARIRAVWTAESSDRDTPAQADTETELPPTMYDGEPFTVFGAGKVPPAAMAFAASSYVRLIVDELKKQERIQLADETVARFLQAVEQAAAEVISSHVMSLVGQQQDGVYTNHFLVVRTASADKFVDLASESMRLWNQMNRAAEGGPRLVFDVAEPSIADRRAIQYSLDLAAADGAPAIPEIRQAMEKLFGPGGKFALLLVRIDDQTALLAAATPEQAATVVERLSRKRPIEWNQSQLAAANALFPEQAQWRAYFSPHGYTTWLSRQMDAIVGVPVVGGPLVKQFPDSPPIGAAGGIRDGELWVDVAVPVETIRGAGGYLQQLRFGRRR
jgi:hypothetical protein